MAQGGHDPDLPFIPDCIQSDDDTSVALDLNSMRQGLPGTPEQPRRRRRHRAGRQAREAKERHEREREERRSRREAARNIPPSDDDLRLPAPAEPTPPPASSEPAIPTRKVARVAPFMHEPRPPMGRGSRGALLRYLANGPALLPPPLHWDHGDGRPVGDLRPQDLPQNPKDILAEARAQPHPTINLSDIPRIQDCRYIARVKPFLLVH